MSRLQIHASLLYSLASSMMLFKMWIGCCVLDSGRPAKFRGESISCVVNIFVSLLLRILVNNFLMVSSRVIGRVILMSFCHSFDFGIGYIVPSFHSWGMMPVLSMSLKILQIRVFVFFPRCLSVSYVMFEGSGALLFFVFLSMLKIS